MLHGILEQVEKDPLKHRVGKEFYAAAAVGNRQLVSPCILQDIPEPEPGRGAYPQVLVGSGKLHQAGYRCRGRLYLSQEIGNNRILLPECGNLGIPLQYGELVCDIVPRDAGEEAELPVRLLQRILGKPPVRDIAIGSPEPGQFPVSSKTGVALLSQYRMSRPCAATGS
jgi:hypothetical protein